MESGLFLEVVLKQVLHLLCICLAVVKDLPVSHATRTHLWIKTKMKFLRIEQRLTYSLLSNSLFLKPH